MQYKIAFLDDEYYRRVFEQRVRRTENPDDCWIWTGSFRKGSRDINGIPYINAKPQDKIPGYSARRYAYEVGHGSLSPDVFCFNQCDDYRCVNPAHTRIETAGRKDLKKSADRINPMPKDTLSARVAGYEYGLRHPVPESDWITDGEIVMWYGSPPPDAIEKAWYQGYNDSNAPDWQDYVSPEAAASTKGVAPNTLYRLLRDDKRRAEHFPRAICEGEGTRRTWHIHIEDLVRWQPSNAGRKRKAVS